MTLVGAVDVGGTTTRAAVVGESGFRAVARTPTAGGRAVADTVITCLRDAMARAGVADCELSGIGVSIPGPLTADRRQVAFTGNVGLREYPLPALLEREFSVPVQMDDDATAAALAEARIGAGRRAGIVFLIIAGTGVGGGLVVRGEPYRGAHSAAGELGHVPVHLDGPRCSCGSFGCLEAVASGQALAARGQGALARGGSPVLAELASNDPARVTAEMVFEAARRGEVAAVRAVEITGRYLGMGAAAVANILDPDLVILGGGLGRQPRIVEAAAAEVAARCIPPIDREVTVLAGELGDDAGLWGAAMLADPALRDIRVA
jgi:glucokinase